MITTALIVFLWIVFAYALYVGIGFIHKPNQPTAVLGFMVGDLRLENGKGDDEYIPGAVHFLCGQSPIKNPAGYYWERWAVTHIQYRSHFGFFLAYPAGFYFWLVWRLQTTEPNPNAVNDPSHPTQRVPGSEQGLVFRLPGWRWSSEGYVLTKGQGGLHYD